MSKHHKPGLSAAELDKLTLEDGVLFHTGKGAPVALEVPLAPLADTHGHLTHFHGHEAAMALARAALVGVRLMVVPLDPTGDAHDAPRTLAWLDEVVERAAALLDDFAVRGMVPPTFPGYEDVPGLLNNVWIVGGTHPYGAEAFLGRGADDRSDAAFGKASREALDVLLQSPRCKGVGEIGLDFGPYHKLGAEVQVDAFRHQLRMAHELGMPVELHLRDEEDGVHATGHDLALRVLTEEGVPEAGCDLHCYTSDAEVMKPFVEMGCHVAFGGAMTFATNDHIREAAVACSAHLLLSETDSPYMAPVPLRGQECEPAMVAVTAAQLCALRPGQDTARALWENACAFFGL